MDIISPAKQRILDVFGKEPESLDELAQCIIAVINNQENTGYDRPRKKYKNYKVVGFQWQICRMEKLHHYYKSHDGPGWSGRVWIRYEDKPNQFGSSPFGPTMTYTGTGGYGSYSGPWERILGLIYSSGSKYYSKVSNHCYSWDYRFFDLDWPFIDENKLYDEGKLIAKLSGKPHRGMHHEFLWEDENQKQLDKIFIQEMEITLGK
jgi:hypothetical protein